MTSDSNCLAVTNVIFSSITASSISISWDAVPGATYEIFYSIDNSTWNSYTLAGTSSVLTGLTSKTGYYIYITSHCGSDACDSVTFYIKTN